MTDTERIKTAIRLAEGIFAFEGIHANDYTRAVDGDFGYYSVVALQNWLRHLGYYTTMYVIDGDWGKVTTRCLQQALNAGKF